MPALSEQCQWLDNSMFHLDGSQCIVHLDALLEIDALDAIELRDESLDLFHVPFGALDTGPLRKPVVDHNLRCCRRGEETRFDELKRPQREREHTQGTEEHAPARSPTDI